MAQIERNPTSAEVEAIRDLYRHMAMSVHRMNAENKMFLRRSILEKYDLGWSVPLIAERYGLRVVQVMDIISSFGSRP